MSSNSSIPQIIEEARQFFNQQHTKSLRWRLTELRNLQCLISENEKLLTDALTADLGKPHFEGSFTEVVVLLTELNSTIDHLEQWMKPEYKSTPLALLPAQSYVLYEPRGVILNISPFNYPVQLAFSPMIAAIAAGNCVILKPSELTPTVSSTISSLMSKYMGRGIYCIEGGIEETNILLKQKFDYIFFTGSEFVGKIIAKAAAEHLTPVTLELGGKSPTIVDAEADLSTTCNRIVWGKFMNCGQTCVAPDYILVHSSIKDKFNELLKKTITKFYTDKPINSNDYGRIVNERHTNRLVSVIKSHESNIIHGGSYDIEKKFIEPTVLSLPSSQISIANVMKEEIFGPILPVFEFNELQTVIDHINSHPKPLALYYFGTDQSKQNLVLHSTSSGGVTINDTIMHLANHELPFGGVGSSGYGAYHGKYGFETFSHRKAVLSKSIYGDSPQRYPPYNPTNYKIFRFVATIHRINSSSFGRFFKVALLPVVVACAWRYFNIQVTMGRK